MNKKEINNYDGCNFPQNTREIEVSNLNYHVRLQSSFIHDTLTVLEKKALSLMNKIKEKE